MKTFIENLIALELVQPGDMVYITNPKSHPIASKHARAPGPGWMVVYSRHIEPRPPHLYIHHPDGRGAFGVVVDRVTDWKPAKERTK